MYNFLNYFIQVGLNSTNAELRGFIDQNLSPTKGKDS